jgi:hypothetical protein
MIFKYRQNVSSQIILPSISKVEAMKWTISTQTIDFEEHSDQVGGSATFLIAIINDFHSTPSQTSLHIGATPPTPNGFQSAIYELFNTSSYCIPIEDAHCKIVKLNDRNPR